MKHSFNSSFAALGLLCALSGLTLAGCNRDGGGGSSGLVGASSGSSSDSLATVGTSKVTRADLNTFLEAQGGEQALPILIDTQLIFEALKTKSLDVTDAEVEADLARRQAAEPQLAAIVTAGGPRLPIIKTQIKREIAVQKLLTAGIAPTEAQVKAFFEKNRRFYDQAPKATIAMLLTSTKTRANLMAEQLKKKTKTAAQLVAEQQKAADPVAGRSAENAAQSPIWSQIAPGVTPITDKLAKGGVSTVQQLAPQPPVFGLFVVTDKTTPVKADFTKIRAEVEADYKSAQIAQQTAAKNPQNPPFDETLRRTFEALKQQNPNGTLRDTLNYINQGPSNELIEGLRTAGTVQIDDATYAKVATPYQAKAATGATGNTASGNSVSAPATAGNAATGSAPAGNAAPATGNTAPATGNTAP